MKINHDEKEIRISIREMSMMASRGDYDHSIGLSNRIRAGIGRDVHSRYQDQIHLTKTNVKTESHIKYTVKHLGWTVILNGKADVVYEENGNIIIEEIKSTTHRFDSEYYIRSEHTKQLQLYAYNFRKQKVLCNMIIYDILADEFHIIPIEVEDQTRFIKDQMRMIIDLEKKIQEQGLVSAKRFETVSFPFPNYRLNQRELINTTEKILVSKNDLLLTAPSGIGKTIGTLFPSIKFALKNKLRVFVATSKTTQQKIYEDTLKLLVKRKASFNSIILTAKEKICNNVEFNCDPSVCPYLKNYLNLDLSKTVTKLLTKNVLTSRMVTRAANIVRVCAFELSLDVSMFCDIIIGDYNYIFHPQIRLRRFFESPHDDTIVIIDEAHNLIQRAIGYYSPSISIHDVVYTSSFLKLSKLSRKLTRSGVDIFNEIKEYISSFDVLIDENAKWKIQIIEIQEKIMMGFQKEIDLFILEYLREYTDTHSIIPSPKDPIIEFAEKLNYFNSILKDSTTPEFSQLYKQEEQSIEILCKSAALKLSKQIKQFHSTIAQSATLFPVEYFRKMLGFPADTVKMEFGSVFPPENQLRMIYPLVSTKYHDRQHYTDDIAYLINNTIKHKKGNYLVFFPSFKYLHSVTEKLRKYPLNANLLVQEPNMSDRKRKLFLKKLKQHDTNYLLAGVYGGIFSEGIDFIGNMAIGVFIIGPGLPAYTFEQELRKQYFHKKWNKGFEYAYRNPGMNKVIQAAGRIFRTDSDKGFVILIGQRFESSYYNHVLPEDWQISTEHHPDSIIREFWSLHGDLDIIKTTQLESLLK